MAVERQASVAANVKRALSEVRGDKVGLTAATAQGVRTVAV